MACSSEPDIEKVPVGTNVQLTRRDGGVVEGRLARRTATDVQVASDTSAAKVRTVAREDIADLKVIQPGAETPLPAAAKFREYTVPEDSDLAITLTSGVSSETSHVGDPVEARLSRIVSVEGAEVLPAGSIVRGVVTNATPTGNVKGRAALGLRFTTLVAYGHEYSISATWAAEAESRAKGDAKTIGIGAGAGALIGGVLGGKKGAAAGAAIGGGAGTAMVLTSAGDPIARSPGTEIVVKVANPFDVRIPVH